MKIIIATQNQGKAREIRALFSPPDWAVSSLRDEGYTDEVDETGATFMENAAIKAREWAKRFKNTGAAVLADDSGLMIDALNGEPGVDSANFMGRETPYEVRNAHIISKLANAADRSAKFVCVIACAFPSGVMLTTEGEIVGEIAAETGGTGGFGYDPIFFLPEMGKTMAELSPSEKNKISHRGMALTQMIEAITDENFINQRHPQ